MLKLKPSLMRHTAVIQSKTRTQDADGMESIAWTNEHTSVPCSVYPLSGKEYVSSAQIGSEITVRITLYNITPFDASMRLVVNSKNYDIIDILPDPTDNVYLTLMARQGVSNG
jgi:SPP1 family predicted phage head-tail adaptor